MKRQRLWLVAFLLTIVSTGCSGSSGSGSPPADTTAPQVVSTAPAPFDADVALNTSFTAQFSEAMDVDTIDEDTFLVTVPGGALLTGTVAYDEVNRVATFLPPSNLASTTTFTATITTGAQDSAGNALAGPHTWNFTTGLTPDLTPPTVAFVIPTDQSTDVHIDQTVTAVFSEPMDADTVTFTTFTLVRVGVGPVSGLVTCPGITATFAPTSTLAPNAVFTATIAVGAEDLAGNAMASPHSWTFTTGSTPDSTAPTVLSTVPAPSASGVAVNTTVLARFSEPMDPSSISVVTFQVDDPNGADVTGIVSYDAVNGVAYFLPTSVLAFSTTYTAVIVSGPSGVKDTAGNVMASHHLWTFTTGTDPDITAPTVTFVIPADLAEDAPIDQVVTVVFSETMDSGTVNSTTFTLVEIGVGPVLGTVFCPGTTATFTSSTTLPPNSSFLATITVGVEDVAGNAMANAYSWAFATGNTPDLTAPTVTSTVPGPSATGVAVNASIVASFSEPMDPSTITTTTFLVEGPSSAQVTGTASYDVVNQVAYFLPASNLAFSTSFTGTITVGAEDTAGNPLATPHTWTFTTGSAPDLTPPTVVFVIPGDEDTDVSIDQVLTAVFSEAMETATVNDASFTLVEVGVGAIQGTVSCPGTTATFTPLTTLPPNSTFIATITVNAHDVAGNALASPYSWDFATGSTPDVTAPQVSSTFPDPGETGVPVNTSVQVQFDEPMAPSTITAETTITTGTFLLEGPGAAPVFGTVSYDVVNQIAYFMPLSDLDFSTTYTGTITVGAEDTAGNPLGAPHMWSFTTGTVADSTAPSVVFVIPGHTDTDVPIDQVLTVVFSETMDSATVDSTTFTVEEVGGGQIFGLVDCPGTTATFTPFSSLPANTEIRATISAAAQDVGGNAMTGPAVWTFTTGSTPDLTAPQVSSTSPSPGAADVAVNTNLAVQFDEPMDPSTLTASTVNSTGSYQLEGPSSAPVFGTISYDVVNQIAYFMPMSDLDFSTTYTATVTVVAEDSAGNALAFPTTWSFTTGTGPDITPPTVDFVVPNDQATDVHLDQVLTAAFSEAMDSGTLTTLTFTLVDSVGGPVTGTVSCPGTTATFTSSGPLALNTTFTATITVGAEDLAGNALASLYTWDFTTGTTPDTTPPEVTTTDPANVAGNIPLNQTFTASFSEPMDSSTITTTTFTLTDTGTGPISGTVLTTDTTATFTPASDLPPSSILVANISAAVTDVVGNPMVTDYSWSVQTGAGAAAGPAPVSLGNAGIFTILTKTGVTNVPSSLVQGNVGASPITGAAIGISCAEVTGTVFTVDPAGPAGGCTFEDPAFLGTAVLDMLAAYNDAAGRTLPDEVALGNGNLNGLILTPGLYKWNTDVIVSSQVDLVGGPNDVWILQLGGDLNLSSGALVNVSGGARAQNIFWQVTGSATFGSSSDFTGIVLSKTHIALQTNAVMSGRALAQTAVTLQANTITPPP